MFIGFTVIALPGCEMFPKMLADIDTKVISISATANANGGYPTAVDVVILNDAALTGAVAGMSAKGWFKGKEQFLLDHNGMSTVITREVVPGQKAPKIELTRSIRVDALSIFAFANYINDGSHRLKLDKIEKPQIILNKTTLELASK
jgi:hypothetical protein